MIGQACEFDYSGTQAVRALKSLGYTIILVNSNPATIMTDPDLADETYVEPLTPEYLKKIIVKTKPDALLPTLGGQTALNLALHLGQSGFLEQQGVKLIGADLPAIQKAEDRSLFRETIKSLNLPLPFSMTVETIEQGAEAVKKIGLPLILRPAFTLGGSGGSFVLHQDEFEPKLFQALQESPIHQVLMEESLLGWKEFELEVMRDYKGTTAIVCSIENLDPMGIHTGDSITVAPTLTLPDKEYQTLRDMAVQIMNAVGIATGGSNIQFAVNPENGKMAVIEMNPRVSRSSALASKATGFPIAKIAAMLAVGLSLDEIKNDITKVTPASYEPALDYAVVKIPRFDFEKFPGANRELTSQMKSIGEVMAVGRTFLEALQKAFRSLEKGYHGLDESLLPVWEKEKNKEKLLETPIPEQIFFVKYAFACGMTLEKIHSLTKIDPWFLNQIQELTQFEFKLKSASSNPEFNLEAEILTGKKLGYSDTQLSELLNQEETQIRSRRKSPEFLAVDTCAGEFPAQTPYFFSSYEDSGDWNPLPGNRVVILGSGPNRIGQGIEFDYCCVQAVQTVRELGYQGIMVNSNPETVSTDYDLSSRLYFEPLYLEHILEILRKEKPIGVIVQFGGQTPLKLAQAIEKSGFPILGTSIKAIHQTESREDFGKLAKRLNMLTPLFRTAASEREAIISARELGYPVLLRPSFVLSGRAMRVIYDEEKLREHFEEAYLSSDKKPVLIDKFLDDALELDVDVLSDGQEVVLMGVMRHIEEAGIHSGDSACILPAPNLSPDILEQIHQDAALLARELGVIGLMNLQMALRGDKLYLLEVNPRASRTVPFVSKVKGIPFVKLATQIMLGGSLQELSQKYDFYKPLQYFGVKAVVFPFKKMQTDPLLGPEMKSTGEAMGMDRDLGLACLKAYQGAGVLFPDSGTVFVSVKDSDKRAFVPLIQKLYSLGFRILATEQTAKSISASGTPVEPVRKIQEGSLKILDDLRDGKIKLVINTLSHWKEEEKAYTKIRKAAILNNVPILSTLSQAQFYIQALIAREGNKSDVTSLQYFTNSLKNKL